MPERAIPGLEEDICFAYFLQVEEPYLHFGVQCHMHWHSRRGRQHTTTHCSNWQTHCMHQGGNGEPYALPASIISLCFRLYCILLKVYAHSSECAESVVDSVQERASHADVTTLNKNEQYADELLNQGVHSWTLRGKVRNAILSYNCWG